MAGDEDVRLREVHLRLPNEAVASSGSLLREWGEPPDGRRQAVMRRLHVAAAGWRSFDIEQGFSGE